MTSITRAPQKNKSATKPPRLYQVILHNDDFTPMDFVVDILQRIFGHDLEKAQLLMMRVHHEGRAVCGVYSHDIAQTKAQQVIARAQENEFPLQCSCEPEQ